MKKLLKFLCSRLVIVSLAILVQLFFLLFIVLKLSTYGLYAYVCLQLLSLLVVLWIVTKRDNPSYKIAWIIVIMGLPLFGGIFYLVFGNKSMDKKQAQRIRDYAYKQVEESQQAAGADTGAALRNESPHLKRQSDYISNVGLYPLWGNTQVEYFPLGEDFWAALLREMKKAEKFIFMEYFIIQEGKMWNAVLDIMKEKAAAGVDVRLMYDDLGTIQTLPPHYYRQMEEAGIKCAVFNPFRPRLNSMFNYRDHRKISVIDGDVGFCGGLNLADEYINAYEKYGHWKDTAVMLRGDGTWNLTMMFLQLWSYRDGKNADYHEYRPSGKKYDSTGYVQPYGDSPIDEFNVAENIYLQIINCAKNYVYITTPYLILDNEMTTALILAAESGVDVRIITPHIPDKWYVHAVSRSAYRQLIEAGVRIYEYTPGFIHAKMFVADDEVGVVGTANMDYRSFYLHFECGVAFFHSPVIETVKQDILKTMEISQEIHPNPDERVPLLRRLGRAILKAFAPLM
ncbi:MAG: cardiolipin synthase [Oscillospiraceae bacterium]|nr:cardiolipin synthase [Oscillospiraceae bacterium]